MKSSFAPLALAMLLAAVAAAACGGKVPETRYYQLAAPAAAHKPGDRVLALELLSTDAGYDDDRIVYRTTPHRLDYYQYHRWSAAPGVIVSNYLEQAFERSGHFSNVIRDVSSAAPVVLGGRVLAIEEVDTSKTRWLGRIVIELTLSDARTSDALWSEQFEETEPLQTQTPEGLAQALSRAMSRIAERAAPTIADLADRQAKLHAETESLAKRP